MRKIILFFLIFPVCHNIYGQKVVIEQIDWEELCQDANQYFKNGKYPEAKAKYEYIMGNAPKPYQCTDVEKKLAEAKERLNAAQTNENSETKQPTKQPQPTQQTQPTIPNDSAPKTDDHSQRNEQTGDGINILIPGTVEGSVYITVGKPEKDTTKATQTTEKDTTKTLQPKGEETTRVSPVHNNNLAPFITQFQTHCTCNTMRGGFYLVTQVGGLVFGGVYGWNWYKAYQNYNTIHNKIINHSYVAPDDYKKDKTTQEKYEADKKKYGSRFWVSFGIAAGSYFFNMLDNYLWTNPNEKKRTGLCICITPNISPHYNGISLIYNF